MDRWARGIVVLVTGVLGAFSGCAGGGSNSPPPPPPPSPNPVPAIVAVNPKSVAAGGPDFYLSVNGTGFVASSVIRWNGMSVPTTFVNETLIFGQVPGSLRQTSSTVAVTVFNPAPSGGVSTPVSVLVAPPPQPPPDVGVIQMISAAPDGSPGNGSSFSPPAISNDGRYVAFQSDSTNLVPGPASGFTEIYLRDTCLGAPVNCTATTTRVSVAHDGSLPNGNSRSPAISANGRFVAFDSSATNLTPNSINSGGQAAVFLRDTCIGAPAGCTPTITLVSVASDGTPANDDARLPAISADGRFLAFNSVATNLVANDTNGWLDVFLRDTCFGAPAGCAPSTVRVSVANDGSQSNAPSCCPSISADGRYISFRMAGANNLVPNQPGAAVILRDTCFGAPAACTPSNQNLFVSYAGGPANGAVDNLWVLSAGGRYSGFGSLATDLVPGNTGQMVGAFVYDSCIGAPPGCIPRTDQVSLTYNGGQPNNGSGAAASSDDGNYVIFISIADNLLPFPYRASALYVRVTCKNAAPDCVPTTYTISRDSSTGIHGNSSYSDFPAITSDGRYAVFISNVPNWPGPLQSNGNNQVWLARVR
jgi:hypothetical protein